uniref:Peptidase A1 domain-containing protein n=1 Tax=Oxyrrhis marina TaxID=2969 RepID=A0A7S4GQ96_OXYMA|mmetsp:Transcript_27127/g.70289  ORF Transcript_27127/g.70289 Transcript_27127/m.70289 type:complete len:436 (+) Transcript_27127:28-1335(+)
MSWWIFQAAVCAGDAVVGLTHKIILDNFDNLQYAMSIEFGGQKLSVVADTGSSDLVLPASNCTTCDERFRRFNPQLSATFRPEYARHEFEYGDGTSTKGFLGNDTLQMGTLTVPDQSAVLFDEYRSDVYMITDGILGLAHHFSDDKKPNERTVLYSIFQSNPRLQAQFAFFLTSQPNEDSFLIFGDTEAENFAKEPVRFGKSFFMHKTELWITSVYSVGWSGTGSEVTFPEHGTLGAPAMIDSGTSYIVLRGDLYDRVAKILLEYLPDCREVFDGDGLECGCPSGTGYEISDTVAGAAMLPSFHVDVFQENDDVFSLCLEPKEYLLPTLRHGRPTCIPTFSRGSEKQPVPIVLGMAFLRAYFTVFDVAHQRIGFARSVASPGAPGAKCRVESHPLMYRVEWWCSVSLAAASIFFAFYVVATWPSKPPAGAQPLIP